MNVEGLVVHVTSVGSPARAEHEILGILLHVFRPIQATFVVREALCDLEIPSRALKLYLEQFNENRVVVYRCNTCWVPCQSGTCYFWGDFERFLANSGLFCDLGATLWC